MDNMDIRTPDKYKTETLVTNLDNNLANTNLSQDISCHELELAILQSIEEAWTKDAECAALWQLFQPLLERLKRIGYYEPEIRTIHDLLSIHLYKYAYQVEVSLSEETCQWIDQKLITVRMSTLEREQLAKALTHLRSTHPRS